VGTYMVPRLVQAGHEVVCVSRGESEPYLPDPSWAAVEMVRTDRRAEERRGTFWALILDSNPDVVIDMICFEPESARKLVEALRGRVQHLLHCGTIWVHGYGTEVPTTEDAPRRPFGEYGTKKAAIEEYLLTEARQNGFPATILHPGHIVGEGWVPINPQGNLNPQVFDTLARAEVLTLPNLGLETLHHVHADDVAQGFLNALNNWGSSVGESFHIVSPKALTLRGYAEAVAAWFGQKANLRFLSWKEWEESTTEENARATWEHVARSSNCSIDKARRLLGYEPRYTSLEALRAAVDYLVDAGVLTGSRY
jgi:nucleoside-diphosphate-sugar epimerase